jgi:hypothetical protein
MCQEITANNRKLVALASGCLSIGLVLSLLLHPSTQSARNVLHFICGMLLGLSLSINLGMVWKSARQRRMRNDPRL